MLVNCGNNLEVAWNQSAPLDTEHLRRVVKKATDELQGIHVDFTRLRSEAHSTVEATRGRALELRVMALNEET